MTTDPQQNQRPRRPQLQERVAITGMGLISPLGAGLERNTEALQTGRHGVTQMHEWQRYGGLNTRLGAPAGDPLPNYPRKRVRTMGRVGLLSLYATESAIEMARLDEELIRSGQVGICYGSTHGSTTETEDFCRRLFDGETFEAISGSSYPKFMSHTCAANLAMALNLTGPVLPVISACTSASQSIGVAFNMVRSGARSIMLCGGAEELHVVHAGVFDLVFAASTGYNDQPSHSPRPFDVARDGLVVGEGAGTLVIESFESARRRAVPILAEIIGFATNCDGAHITAPSSAGMAQVMRQALEDAALDPSAIEYINAHATATVIGDIAEAVAIEQTFGTRLPVSSTKGHTGHTLGACGAIEAIYCVQMMREGFLAPTRNLTQPDPRCAPLNYVRELTAAPGLKCVMNNNFAFGGINTSFILGVGE